jgi:ribonuclease R
MKRKINNNRRKHSKAASRKKRPKLSRKQELERTMMRDVLAYMRKHSQKAMSVKEVASGTGLWRQVGNPKIRALLDKLAKRGKIAYLDRGKYKFITEPRFITGEIQITRSGIGFLLQEENDIFIGPGKTGKAFNGDIVKIRLLSRRGREGRKEGQVIEIIQRKREDFVGVITEDIPGKFFFVADDTRIKTDFIVRQGKTLGAHSGQKVQVKLVDWEHSSPEVEVIRVLGEVGEHETEMHAILLQYGFDPKFPEAVEAEAEKIPEKIPAHEIKARRDMRAVPTFTIDPTDAKDFDDALSFQVLENGRFEVGIHIADVSYYVKPGTELDKEAFERGTSVYLVDRTVPMLPEKLSNKVCSLRPHEEKLTYSAIFEMDSKAKVHKYWIGRTIILSDHRFDYGEAQEVIDGEREGPFAEEMLKLHQLASVLRDQRMKKGSIRFETNEVKFELDENDKPVRIVPYEMKDSNHMIEDFMLLANRTVAAHIYHLKEKPPLHSVYRIHDQPDPEKLSNLGQFAGAFGYNVNFEKRGQTSAQLNKLLASVEGTPSQNMIETLAIRSMAKAVYSTKNVGHFGLGFKFYTHFTSPIRRYPDLMVHRLLNAYGNKEYKQDPNVMEAQCKHSSNREKTATEAERASIKYKQVEFLEERIGQEFNGIISGIIEAGFFVELEENLCEGFVPVRSLDDDYYRYQSDEYSFVGVDTGRVLRLGDPVVVEIAGTDLQRRTVDMKLIEKRAVTVPG